METYKIAALFLLVLVAGGCAGWAIAHMVSAAKTSAKQLQGRVNALEEKVAELKTHEEKVKELENRHLHPHATRDGLEDTIAILLDVIQESKNSRDYADGRIRQASDVLRTIRSDPHGYRDSVNQKQLFEQRSKNGRK